MFFFWVFFRKTFENFELKAFARFPRILRFLGIRKLSLEEIASFLQSFKSFFQAFRQCIVCSGFQQVGNSRVHHPTSGKVVYRFQNSVRKLFALPHHEIKRRKLESDREPKIPFRLPPFFDLLHSSPIDWWWKCAFLSFSSLWLLDEQKKGQHRENFPFTRLDEKQLQ